MSGQELGIPHLEFTPVNLHLGSSVCCALASAGANLRQMLNKEDETHLGFCD